MSTNLTLSLSETDLNITLHLKPFPCPYVIAWKYYLQVTVLFQIQVVPLKYIQYNLSCVCSKIELVYIAFHIHKQTSHHWSSFLYRSGIQAIYSWPFFDALYDGEHLFFPWFQTHHHSCNKSIEIWALRLFTFLMSF